MNEHLATLEPKLLWQHFHRFCETPRPSFKEEQILAAIEAWADGQNLAYERDAANNLLIKKPATPGFEQAKTIVLQGHVDMVSEAADGIAHDFETDPIETLIEGDWLTANGTTLGADNGVGAAAALAILEEDIDHGPLEVLLTVTEEVSLVGARHLQAGWLQGQWLLNLDSEESGEITIGCAGGANVECQQQLEQTPVAADSVAVELAVDGLIGGHSGIDIATGRANANVLLARVLYQLRDMQPRLVSYSGGKMDNAITRTAKAVVSIVKTALPQLGQAVTQCQQVFAQELLGVDENVRVTHQVQEQPKQALTAETSRRLIGLLYALPYGPERMSLAAEGVVETSNNLGIVQLQDGQFSAQLMVRSLVDSARDNHVARMVELFNLAGFKAQAGTGYPGWAPNPHSELLERFKPIYAQAAGAEPHIKVIHAGLECGLIGAKYPAMDMVSFGPTIRGAHSPDERVSLTAVKDFYHVLKAAITELATASL